jgi:hypothetical protein
LQLGEIEVLSPPRAYPLGFSIARSFIADRFALIGDAAHVVHPIAGQGLNLGLRDVAALAECIAESARLGLDPGSPDVLARYERWRRFDTTAMSFSMDALNRLFSNRSDALRLLRDVGLGLVDRAPPLKRMFAAEAAGLTATCRNCCGARRCRSIYYSPLIPAAGQQSKRTVPKLSWKLARGRAESNQPAIASPVPPRRASALLPAT